MQLNYSKKGKFIMIKKNLFANRKNIKRTVVAVSLVSALSIAGLSAYFTDADSKNNTFTIGKVKQQLLEPNWNEENAKNITPNEVIKKDPQVKNTGINDQYVFVTVKVPKKSIITAQDDGTKNTAAADTQLFSYTVNEGWTQLGDVKQTAGANEYTYYYGKADTLTSLAKDATTPTVFDTVKFCNAIEGQGLEESTQNIEVKSYGIQASNLGDDTTPAAVWNIMNNQVAGSGLNE